ncbi:MAG: DUF4190 domain-containing protein [Bacteroidetes bacterium]|nr:DUF4190 domain-containing protein [Fibrella sp.]
MPAILFILVSIYLSGCSPAPQAYFQRGPAPSYERTVRATETVAPAPRPTADLTASLVSVPPAPTHSLLETAEAPAEQTIRVVVGRPTIWHQYKRLLPRKSAAPGCDQIVLRNGDVVEAKVKEVGVNEVRYKKCDRQDGPDYTISKRDILSIKYSNGEVERFNATGTAPNSSSGGNRPSSYNSPTNPQSDGPRTDPFAIVAISAGGLAILTGVGAFLLGAGAVVFGALSLSRIRKEPGRFKGKGLAVAGMVAGIVAAGIILLYLLL